MRRAIRQAVADARTGVREPYFWLIMAMISAAMITTFLGDSLVSAVLLALAAASLEVHRRTA